MFFTENLKQTIYIAHHSVTDGVNIFAKPTEYRVSCYNILPTSASADLGVVGTSWFGYLEVVGDPEYLKDVKELDKVYVYVQPPADTDPLALEADYFVKAVMSTPMCCKIYLKATVNDGR